MNVIDLHNYCSLAFPLTQTTTMISGINYHINQTPWNVLLLVTSHTEKRKKEIGEKMFSTLSNGLTGNAK